MKFNVPVQLEKQLEHVQLLDRQVFTEMLKPEFNITQVGNILEEQLQNWTEIRSHLIRLIGEDHDLIKKFDQFLFERHAQVTLLKLNIRFSPLHD